MRKPFDSVPIDPNRETVKPLRDGVPVGTIRTRYSEIPPTYVIACEHCGHEASRTEWQAEHTFKCWECGETSRGLHREAVSEPVRDM